MISADFKRIKDDFQAVPQKRRQNSPLPRPADGHISFIQDFAPESDPDQTVVSCRGGYMRFLGRSLLTVLLVWAIAGCSTYHAASSPAAQLIAASKAAGIEVLPDQVFTVSRGNETFVTAPIASWLRTPAAELRNGVNIAFAYVAATEPKVPPGYYTIRAFADDIRVGTVPGRAQLIDRNGKVAAEIPGQVEIHSLTVPPNARTIFVTTGGASPEGRIRLWVRCDNGQCFLFGVFRVVIG
jgi:hypothetical protein